MTTRASESGGDRRVTDVQLSPADPALNAAWVAVSPDVRPMLFVVVDTEEQFDWAAPFSTDHVKVSNVRKIARAQSIFDRYGLRPNYVIDFPVATQPDGYLPLMDLLRSGACSIGAHLHPWVTPPHAETINARHSYACNLDPALEEAKLRVTSDAIEDRFGIKPRVYKAGRYGFGRFTAALLEKLGFDVDTSINPCMDFSADGGPSFDRFDACPFLFGRSRRLLELPCTTAYVGLAARAGRSILRTATANTRLRLPGLLARLLLVDRLMLSPEGYTLDEMRRLTVSLLARNVRTFTLSFHSPSLEPGHTPYVRTARDLEQFLARIDAYCDFFFGTIGGVAVTLDRFLAGIRRRAPAVVSPAM
jgi:hypothetical protein